MPELQWELAEKLNLKRRAKAKGQNKNLLELQQWELAGKNGENLKKRGKTKREFIVDFIPPC